MWEAHWKVYLRVLLYIWLVQKWPTTWGQLMAVTSVGGQQFSNVSKSTLWIAWFTWMGSMDSVEGRGSCVCEVWYIGGGVGETMGTCEWTAESRHIIYSIQLLLFTGRYMYLCLYLKNLLVWAQVGQEPSWIVIAGTQGELKQLHFSQPEFSMTDFCQTCTLNDIRKVVLSVKHTWRTNHLWYIHVLSGFHWLCWYNSWVNGRSIKLQHWVLGTKVISTMVHQL